MPLQLDHTDLKPDAGILPSQLATTGDQTKFLRADGTWVAPPGGSGSGNSDGWYTCAEQWNYVSSDDSIRTHWISTPSDVRGNLAYAAGAYVRMLAAGTYRYFRIMLDPSYASGVTTLTLFAQNNSGAGAAIDGLWTSGWEKPLGVLNEPLYWQFTYDDPVDRVLNGPSTGSWYSLGDPAQPIYMPPGSWDVYYEVCAKCTLFSPTGPASIFVNLSSLGPGTEGDRMFTGNLWANGPDSIGGNIYRRKLWLNLGPEKQTWYLIAMTRSTNVQSIALLGADWSPSRVRIMPAFGH